MPVDREALVATLTEYTCGQRCMGIPGNKGGCCTVADRDFIIGPVGDADAFLARLSEREGRDVPREEVLVEHAEGRALFPDRSTWQQPQNYPALRVVMNDEWHPCRFWDRGEGRCTVYAIRPAICHAYACGPLQHLISLV